jgi:hypothetical protein
MRAGEFRELADIYRREAANKYDLNNQYYNKIHGQVPCSLIVGSSRDRMILQADEVASPFDAQIFFRYFLAYKIKRDDRITIRGTSYQVVLTQPRIKKGDVVVNVVHDERERQGYTD